MILELSFSSDASQSFVSQLGERKIGFSAIYNDRSGIWTMSLEDDTTKEVLVQSIPLVLGQELLEPYNLGIGRMIVIDTSGRGIEATAEDLGDRVKVYWASADEVLL